MPNKISLEVVKNVQPTNTETIVTVQAKTVMFALSYTLRNILFTYKNPTSAWYRRSFSNISVPYMWGGWVAVG